MNASLFFRLSALVVALFLGGCAVAPDAPVTGIATPLSPTQARQLLRNMHGALSFGTSIAAHTEDIRTVRVGRDSVTINRQRLAFQDMDHLAISRAHMDSSPAYLVLSSGLALYTGLGEPGNKRAQRLADALLTLKAATSPEAVALEQQQFDTVVQGYRAADPKPGVTEDMRRYEIQAEAAVQTKQFAQASDLYDQALQIAPWWPQAHFNRALILETLEEYDLAIDEMQRYLRLAPDATNARAAQDKIYAWELKVVH